MTDVIIRALRPTFIGALIVGVFVVIGVMSSTPAKAAPGINQQLNFQGRLLTASGATVADGYYNMQFKIYQDGTGTVAGNPSGTLKWTESWLNTNGNGVQVKNGYLSLQLGSITSLSSVDWNQDTLWLSINVGNTNVSCTPFASCAGDGEMLPMKRLASTPYAFNAGQLGGLTSTQFLQLAQGVQTEAGTNTNSIAINKTGTGNFLNLQANGVDVFKITNAGDITFGSSIDHAISVSTAAASTGGKALTISAGTAGTGATALTGGTLTLQGGNGGGTGGNGGNLVLDAGAAAGGGTGGTITIGGTNASSITLGQNTTVSSGKSLTITGSGTRPASPTEGMIYYDTTTKQLITYSNGKWQGDRNTSTKIVAASNASQALKDGADYVATGTSDQTVINTALSAAAGGRVYLTEGTFTTDDVISIPNDTTLAGAGRGSLIKFANINGQTKNMITNTDTTATSKGVTVRDLQLDGNWTGVNTTGTINGISFSSLGGGSGSSARQGPTVLNTWVVNFLTYGIYLNTSPNGTLSGNNIQAGGGNGIYLSSSNRTTVTGNTSQGNTGSGIVLGGASSDVVTGNIFAVNGTAGIYLNGGSNNNNISGNTLYNNGGNAANNAIYFPGSANADFNTITDNSINDTSGTTTNYAINITDSSSDKNYLAGNVFTSTGGNATINDAGTGTIYGSQPRAEAGGQITNRTANDAAAFTVQNASGSNVFAVDTTSSQIVVGNSSTAGKLVLNDGSNHTGIIQMATGSGSYTYTLPAVTANDTFCLVTLNNCAANSALFIQNQNTAAQTTSNFWISGTGRAETSLLTPTLDTATGVALNIGTTSATSVNIGKAATVTTINGKLGITLDATTGTTITCRNASGYLSVCDSSVLTPSAANFIQNGTSVQTGANFWIDGFGKIAGGVQTGNIDTIGAAGSLNIGTSSAGSLTIGKTGVTTTIQGNIGVTLNATTGTTQVCRNATGLLSSCDATYQAPTATNFIQNQATTPGTAQTANFNITGTGIAGTLQAANIIGTTFDTATAATLNIGTSGTPTTNGISLNQNATVATGRTLRITGDTRANITANITSPSEGTLVYDSTNHQMLQWNGTKWVNNGSEFYLVAANNSSQADKDAADYVATGSSDQTTIQSALDRADPASAVSGARKSGKVYLFAGTYTINGTISIPNNTTLAGSGTGTVITIPNAVNASLTAITNATTGGSGTGVVIQDLKLDGNKANQSAGSYGMYGIMFNGMGSGTLAGGKIQNVWTTSWYGNGVTSWTYAGIYISTGSHNVINNVVSQSNTNNGIAITGTYTTLTGSDFTGNNYGIHLSSNNNTVTGNTSAGNTANGIYLENASQNTVSGNVATGNTTTNIYLSGSSSNTISGNQALGSSSNDGIGLSSTSTYNIISSNIIQANSSGGVSISSTSTNNTITSNKIHNNGGNNNKGVYFSNSNNNSVTNNVISDLTTTASNNPINIDANSANTYLSNNYFTSTAANGTIADANATTIYVNQPKAESGGQITNRVANDTAAFTFQKADGTNVLTVDTSNSKVLIAGTLDTTTATPLNIGTTTANAITIGSGSTTTTIQGNTVVTLNTTTGTTMVCRNASGVLSTCDAGYLAPTTTNFIQNGTAQQTSSNFNISGTGQAAMFQAATSVLTPLLDAATASTVLNIGTTNASAINLNQNVVLAAGKSLTMTGGNTASRPGTPTDGMMYYDTDTKQLLVYNAALTKWTADKSEAILVAANDSSAADKAAADYIATGAGDQAQINSALTSADPAGSGRKTGKVYLFAGTYTINGSVSIPNNTTLAGAGRGTVITIANSFNTAINAITNTSTGGTGTSIVIQDLNLDGNRANNTTAVNMYGIYLNGVGTSTSSASTVLGAKIVNVSSSNWRNAGIYLNNTYVSTITNSFMQNDNTMGILLANSSNNIISNNIMIANSNGVYLNTNSANNTFTSNFFAGNGTTGIALQSTSNANTVTSNRFVDNGNNNNNAIYLVSSTNNTIVNNAISDTTYTTSNYAINITDVGSTGNYLSGNTLGAGSINDATSGSNTYAGQLNGSTNYMVQPAGTVELMKNTNVTGTLSASISVLAPSFDRASAGTLTIGTNATNTTALTIGSASVTTTIAGNTGVTLNGTTGTTMVCRNATGLLSGCDATYLTPTASNFIQNQNSSAQTTANFWISGAGQAATLTAGTVNATTNLVTPSIDAAGAVALTLGGTTASSVDIGKAAGTINLKANSTLVGTSGSTITIQGAAQSTPNAAGNLFTLKGSTGNGSGAGGQLTVQGGDGGATSGANGGNLLLSGGSGTGTGVNGLVLITTPTFSTVTNDTNCFTGGAPVASTCTIAASSVNGSGAILVGFTADGQTATLPDPTISTAGRVVYVTASNTSNDFTLSVNGGGQGNQIAMRKNTTATMIWNGADWTAAGASSSTTLQAAYDNTLQSAGGAELVVSKTSATNGITIRDSTTNSVNGALLTVQSSSAANLFSVNSNVTEYATDAGAEVYGASTTAFPANTWATLASPVSTVSRYITAGDNIATGQGSVSVVTPATANAGVMNRLSSSLTANQTYNVSFSVRLASGSSAFTDMTVYYSINGVAQSVVCATGQTAKTSIWTKINCTFQAPSSGITSTNSILIQQATGVARTFYVDNLSVTIAANFNYATDAGVDNAGSFATNWSAAGTATVAQNLADGFDASSSAQATTSTANSGVRNLLSINPLASTLYRVSVYTKLNSGAALNDFKVRYTPNAGTNFIDCVDYNTQVVSSSWAQITCYIKTDATTLTTPYVYFLQTTASGSRVFSVDTFSMTLASNSTPNVQVGSGSNGGPTTLFTLDKGASAPIAANNDALLGSMYYDTTLGKLQCYEADGWGACGSSPDNIITISPEYTNAVMHGTGIGTMTSDFCSSALNINDGTSSQPTICSSGETYNFYKWTSPQATSQAYSIYVTYQLPTTFKTFASGQTSVQARVDSTSNASVQLQIYKNHSGLTTCGSNVTLTTSANTWQAPVASGTADPSTCGFAGGDSIVFKITLSSKSNANAYIGNLNFTFSNK